MGCLLWVWSQIYVLLLSSQCRIQYRDKVDRFPTALDCNRTEHVHAMLQCGHVKVLTLNSLKPGESYSVSVYRLPFWRTLEKWGVGLGKLHVSSPNLIYFGIVFNKFSKFHGTGTWNHTSLTEQKHCHIYVTKLGHHRFALTGELCSPRFGYLWGAIGPYIFYLATTFYFIGPNVLGFLHQHNALTPTGSYH